MFCLLYIYTYGTRVCAIFLGSYVAQDPGDIGEKYPLSFEVLISYHL